MSIRQHLTEPLFASYMVHNAALESQRRYRMLVCRSPSEATGGIVTRSATLWQVAVINREGRHLC